MPSTFWPARTYSQLEQVGLTANQQDQVKVDNAYYQRLEEERFRAWAQEQRAAADEREAEWAQKYHDSLVEWSDKVKRAKAGHLSAQEMVALRAEMLQATEFFAGDGKDREGIITALDKEYAKAEEIEADPGAHADAFYQKWAGSLGDTRVPRS